MKLSLYNSLTRKKEEFKSIKPGKVGLYTCGPTVYNYAHIGNLRTYIFEDILKRVLAYNEYAVKHVMNITDVGHLTGTQAFKKDINHLNILAPDIWVKATDTIPEQIALIGTLEDKGYTYQTADGTRTLKRSRKVPG
jgi:cysteinyl-tRNA synthetase